MSTLLDCPSFSQDNNTIGFFDGRETMSDSDGCATFCDSVKSHLDHFFAFGIDSAGSFVEYDDLWLLDYASCNGDTLFLTSR